MDLWLLREQRGVKGPACIRPQAAELLRKHSRRRNLSEPQESSASGCCAGGWRSGGTRQMWQPGSTEGRGAGKLWRGGSWGETLGGEGPPTCSLTTKEMLPPFSITADLSFFFSLKGRDFSSRSIEQFSKRAMAAERTHPELQLFLVPLWQTQKLRSNKVH